MPFPTETRSSRVKQAELDAASDAPLPPEVLRTPPSVQPGHERDRRQASVTQRGETLCARRACTSSRANGCRAFTFILNGEAVLTARDQAGKDREIARLGRGEFFGEQSLVSGNPSDISVAAASDLELLILDSEALQGMLDRTPQLSREIGHVIEARRKAIASMRTPAQALDHQV